MEELIFKQVSSSVSIAKIATTIHILLKVQFFETCCFGVLLFFCISLEASIPICIIIFHALYNIIPI